MKLRIENNVRWYYLYYFFYGLIFTIPIWVMFYRRILSFPEIAALHIITSLTTIVLELPTGTLADLIGRKRTILLGLLTYGLSVIGVGFATNFSQFLVLALIAGFGGALVSGADSALLYDSIKQTNRLAEYSPIAVKVGFLYRLGLVIGSFTGGYLYAIWVSLPYLLKGVSVLIGAFFVLLMVEPTIDSDKFSLHTYVLQTKQGIKELTRTYYIKLLALYYVLVGGITWACLYYFNQPFALDFNFTETQMSWVFGFVYLSATVVLYWLTKQANLLTRKRVYLGFPILMTLSLLPGLIVPKMIAPLFIFGIQLAGSARFAILDKYVNKEIQSKNRATANSTLNMSVELVHILLVYFGGMIQAFWNTKAVFSLFGLISLSVVSPLAILLVKENQRYLNSRTGHK